MNMYDYVSNVMMNVVWIVFEQNGFKDKCVFLLFLTFVCEYESHLVLLMLKTKV